MYDKEMDIIFQRIQQLLPWQRETKMDDTNANSNKSSDVLYLKLRQKAIELTTTEPYLGNLLKRTILHPKSTNFNSTISRIIASRVLSSCGSNPIMCDDDMNKIIEDAMNSKELEYGHTMADATVEDIMACYRRDPACETELEVVLFYKGFAALVCHRAARRHYFLSQSENNHDNNYSSGCSKNNSKRFVSLWLQSQASAAFGVDIHPAAEIGAGVFFDHATGLVIGETAKVGNNCTILHGVTLGGTGKHAGDRHPKVGDHVLIGAGTSILGNIKIGNGAKIGAGSIVLSPIPHGATAVGSPAKVIGWARESRPGSIVDMSLRDIVPVGDDVETSDDESNQSGQQVHEANKETDKRIQSSALGKGHRQRRNSLCIFRSVHHDKRAGQLSYYDFSEALNGMCTEDEIGEVYMELLKKENHPRVTTQGVCKHFQNIAMKYTNISTEKCSEALNMIMSKRRSSI